jgi:hypothetical protein
MQRAWEEFPAFLGAEMRPLLCDFPMCICMHHDAAVDFWAYHHDAVVIFWAHHHNTLSSSGSSVMTCCHLLGSLS